MAEICPFRPRPISAAAVRVAVSRGFCRFSSALLWRVSQLRLFAAIAVRIAGSRGFRCGASAAEPAIAAVAAPCVVLGVVWGSLRRVAACCGVLRRVAACCGALLPVRRLGVSRPVRCGLLRPAAACCGLLRRIAAGAAALVGALGNPGTLAVPRTALVVVDPTRRSCQCKSGGGGREEATRRNCRCTHPRSFSSACSLFDPTRTPSREARAGRLGPAGSGRPRRLAPAPRRPRRGSKSPLAFGDLVQLFTPMIRNKRLQQAACCGLLQYAAATSGLLRLIAIRGCDERPVAAYCNTRLRRAACCGLLRLCVYV